MAKEEIYCGLDIGSGCITGILGKYNAEEGKIEILTGKQLVDRNAIAAGVIKDIDRCSSLINDIINEMETTARVEKTKLIVGVRGVFINTYDTSAQIPITSTDRTITIQDSEKVTDHAIKSLRISNERTIMAVLPQEYVIDGQAGITNPVGMEGSMLEVKAHVVVANASFIRNIERTFTQAGHVIDNIQYGLIPLSQLVTDAEERNMGCLVLDFSGQSIGVVVYKDGCIRYSKEFCSKDIDFGSDLITREIAAYYKTSWNIAENIKRRYGACQPSAVKKDEQIEIPSRDGKNIKITTKKELARIIAEVLESIFLDRLFPELRKIQWVELALEDGDVVLTGGGANMFGITDALRELFKNEYSELETIEVRPGSIGIENNIVGDEEILSNFSYTTAISLIKSDIENEKRTFKGKSQEGSIKKLFKKIWSIFE